jgi:hypothetical protein
VGDPADVEAQRLVRADDERAVQRALRRDGRDEERGDGGRHDRAAGRERVGGRAERRGDHDGVGAVPDEDVAVDDDVDVERTAAGDAGHDDVVERGPHAAAGQARLEAEQRLEVGPARRDGVEGGGDLVGGDVGQERDVPRRDPEHRHRVRGRRPQRAEQRSVAAHGDEQVERPVDGARRSDGALVGRGPAVDLREHGPDVAGGVLDRSEAHARFRVPSGRVMEP